MIELEGISTNETYVVAVSGGIDSMVLLDLLRKRLKPEQFAVAHYQHNVRPEEEMVEDLAVVESYCTTHDLNLHIGAYPGDSVSEAQLREARYEFLHTVKSNLSYNKIITAHHKDDVAETAIINTLRGTGSAGLVALATHEELVRPLINYTKVEIAEYAQENDIRWSEDSTNSDDRYLRNYVRNVIVPLMERDGSYAKLSELIEEHRPVEAEIESELSDFLNANNLRYENGLGLFRDSFIQLPHAVACRLMRLIFDEPGANITPSEDLVQKAVIFAKTAKHGSSMDLSKNARLAITPDLVELLIQD